MVEKLFKLIHFILHAVRFIRPKYLLSEHFNKQILMVFKAAVCQASDLLRPNLKLQFCTIFWNTCRPRSTKCSVYSINNRIIYEQVPFVINNRRSIHNDVKHSNFIDFIGEFNNEEKESIYKNMNVIESFINSDEEVCLLKEIEPYMKRLRYEFSHWDNAIHGYRETERLKWNEENTKIINRVRNVAFLPGSPQLSHVHILDLAEDGFIKPHIDAVRFCGNTIAGLSLLTDSVMRLVHDKDKTKVIDVLLQRHSLYVMRDCVRYDYTHEILAKPESKFKTKPVEKKRRISVICRNEPSSSDKST